MRSLVVLLHLVVWLYAQGDLFVPLPPPAQTLSAKAVLGKELFFDPMLSRDGSIACAHCHNFAQGGADGLALPIGIEGRIGTLHTPTVFNATFNISQNWSGNAPTLADQAKGPLTHPNEMANDFPTIIQRLATKTSYREAFGRLYGGRITAETITDALAAFQAHLVTPGSRFDRFLQGDAQALSADEKEGFELFKKKGCASCHNGINIGANMYQKIGVIIPWQKGTEWLGRYHVTQDEREKFFMKVPTLRNITLTAPYFHDGSVTTLHKAVELMLHHQLGEEPDLREVALLVAFLQTLEGVLDGRVAH